MMVPSQKELGLSNGVVSLRKLKLESLGLFGAAQMTMAVSKEAGRRRKTLQPNELKKLMGAHAIY